MSAVIKVILKLARWRVRAGLPAALLVLLFSRPNSLTIFLGLFLSLSGLALRAWAAGHLHKNAFLATTGPYRFSRNPLYLANLVIGLGLAATANSLPSWLIFLLYFLLFYPSTIIEEQRRMAELFPEQYHEYGRKVPLFFPSLRPSFPSPHKKFRLALYFQNKEYRALIAVLGYWLLLFIRWLWLKA